MDASIYLRKYQASSATMSSSRDRTSTVRRMWLVGNGTSSKEEGEAERRGQRAPSTKKQEGGGWAKVTGRLHVFKVLEPVKRKIPTLLSSVLVASI